MLKVRPGRAKEILFFFFFFKTRPGRFLHATTLPDASQLTETGFTESMKVAQCGGFQTVRGGPLGGEIQLVGCEKYKQKRKNYIRNGKTEEKRKDQCGRPL